MNETIKLAILQNQLLRFSYAGGRTIVEPYCYGANEAGEQILQAYKVGGDADADSPVGWRTYKVADMKDVTVTGQRFGLVRGGYDPNDPAMSKVFCKVEFK